MNSGLSLIIATGVVVGDKIAGSANELWAGINDAKNEAINHHDNVAALALGSATLGTIASQGLEGKLPLTEMNEAISALLPNNFFIVVLGIVLLGVGIEETARYLSGNYSSIEDKSFTRKFGRILGVGGAMAACAFGGWLLGRRTG